MVGPWQLEKSQQEFYPNKGFGVAKIKNGKEKYPLKVYSEKLVEALLKNVTDC
jgi:hypothetical protein